MKHILTYCILFFAAFPVFAQSGLTGTLVSETEEPLIGATVVLLNSVDSTIVEFSISNTEGQFEMTEIPSGKHILQLSYVSYANQSLEIVIDQAILDLGTIIMKPSSEILQEVTLKAEHIPMGILGDTINYNAAAFKTKAGATVEDLLKKLPGVEVARDGSIKAQGKDVEKVLVDGKEFFGDDPKIATQNLEAEAVDKVQVFDKQSEMAEFTGIDDGQEEKTINLKLKEGYKSGGFGNVKLAGGTSSTYDGKLNYNRFNTTTQASILASTNNINKQAFSFNEFIGFMGGLSNAMSANSGIFNFGNMDGGSPPPGIRDDISGGLNLNVNFSEKLKLNSNYFYLSTKQHLIESNNAIQFLNEDEYTSNNELEEQRKNINHRLNAKLTFKPSPYTEVVWKNAFLGLQNNLNSISETSFQSRNVLSNLTNSNYNLDGHELGYKGSFQVKKKFEKKGRNWINTFKYSLVEMDQQNDIKNDYLLDTGIDLIDQNQTYDNLQKEYSIHSAYTEPLGNKTYLNTSLSYTKNTEEPEKLFYDLEGSERILNNSLSTLFNKSFQFFRPGINIKKNSKKSKLTLGLSSQWTYLEGSVSGTEDGFSKDYQHLLPNANWSYDFNSSTSFELGYNTSINAPSLNQLLPVIDNSNANFSIVGNQDLDPEYAHSMSMHINHFDNFNFTNFFFNIRLSLIEDRIVNGVTIDPSFLKTLKPINSENFKSANSYISFSKPVKALKLKYRISSRSTFNSYESFLNGGLNQVKEISNNLGVSIENRKKENVDIATGVKVNYSNRSYSQNEDFNQQFYNYSLFVDFDWFATKTLTFSSSFDYQQYSNEFFAKKQTFNLLNASIKKTFNDNKFSIELIAFDILGQNIGLNRTGGINSLNELTFNTLKRHVRLGLAYRLGKKRKKGGIQIGDDEG